MEKVRYMISDAARMVALEQHVLRYWEDELQLDIPRNEMLRPPGTSQCDKTSSFSQP